jgi:DNA-3-methyladenine glycosylase
MKKSGRVISLDWYQSPDTIQLSRELLGKVLCAWDGQNLSAGIIVETEAYCGTADQACHARGGNRSPRTEIMYARGGVAYVYICYGIHYLFNVITHQEGEPHAILVRALEPLEGIDLMLQRRKIDKLQSRITKGPGSLTQALGISKADNGLALNSDRVWIEDRGINIEQEQILSGPRVGIKGAGEPAVSKDWRFWVKDSPWVSRWVP